MKKWRVPSWTILNVAFEFFLLEFFCCALAAADGIYFVLWWRTLIGRVVSWAWHKDVVMRLNSCFVRQYVASDIIFEYQMLIQISCSFMLAAICLSSCWNLYVAFSVSSLSMTCFIGWEILLDFMCGIFCFVLEYDLFHAMRVLARAALLRHFTRGTRSIERDGCVLWIGIMYG